MKYLLCILIINFVNVDCGLLGDALTPVTEAAQNNALLDEHEQKEAKHKGLVSNVVDSLDSGVDTLTNLLGQGKKDKKDDKNTDDPKDGAKDLESQLAGGKNNTEELKKQGDEKKKELESSTPKVDLTTPKECKDEECKEKLKDAKP